jgi:hypothetical protein
MLASRLASRTILTSERVRPSPSLALLPVGFLDSIVLCCLTPPSPPVLQDQGTQTSLSFETSSSIREEYLALLEEEEEEERLRLQEEKEASGWTEDDERDPREGREERFVGDMDWEELKQVSRRPAVLEHPLPLFHAAADTDSSDYQIHLSHLLDPNYDPTLLRNERQTLMRFADSNASQSNLASLPPSNLRSSSPSGLPSDSFPLSYLPSLSTGRDPSDTTRRRVTPGTDDDKLDGGSKEELKDDGEGGAGSQRVEDMYTEWGFDEGEEDSVYAEVRAAVANTDDPSMPVNTLR